MYVYILNEKSLGLADVAAYWYMPSGSIKHKGYGKFSKMFCDSMVFWGLYNASNETTKGQTTGKYIAELRETFTRLSLPFDSIKTVNTDILSGDKYFSEAKLAQEYRGQPFCAGCIAIKVSLEHCRAKKVVAALASVLPRLQRKHLVLHDIDMTRDCWYVSNLNHLEYHLEANGVTRVMTKRQ
ncbi:hypothetical protein BGZ83_011129 [Gryganskiella cystojenkinii]|nr:hypothetical protein BGZ83_011129 [Gryganskiella cystojenkinii]